MHDTRLRFLFGKMHNNALLGTDPSHTISIKYIEVCCYNMTNHEKA